MPRTPAARLVGGAPARTAAAHPTLEPTGVGGLRLLNSLSGETEPFVPIKAGFAKWYVCGPTVYDAAHLGHARNYIAFDIVRRVLIDYFGIDILYVMNITDIDDKIILRAHANHLQAMLHTALDALGVGVSSTGVGVSSVSSTERIECSATIGAEAKEKLIGAVTAAEGALGAKGVGLPRLLAAQSQLAAACAEVDGLPALETCDVKRAFLELTTDQEASFFADMAALNVMPPDAITRVTDYVPEIVTYIERIFANGYCYESNGSVYFDTAAFAKSGKRYGKLEPGKVGDLTLLAEGEGALSTPTDGEKKAAADFALWKRSKAGEPAWASPWGEGRPGWHIECSAMASELLGDQVDLNSGGSDLKFPHHENQMAQAEAHFDCCSWVNYFLHSGHLQIEGLKMSKSLKNFITIREALEEFSPRQIRFLFLLHRYHEPMEYSLNSMAAAADLERRFASFGSSLATRLADAEAFEGAAVHKLSHA